VGLRRLTDLVWGWRLKRQATETKMEQQICV
jgi:hypothetical protein